MRANECSERLCETRNAPYDSVTHVYFAYYKGNKISQIQFKFRQTMDDRIRHLLLGIGLLLLHHLLDTRVPLMRLCGSITGSQTLGLITAGEIVTLLPFAGTVHLV